MVDAQGHLNGSLKVSIPLRQMGYQIHYLTNSADNSWYRKHDFSFTMATFYGLAANLKKEKSILKYSFNRYLDKLTDSILDNRICQLLELKGLIETIQPDLLFVDSFLSVYHIAFKNYDCRCFQLETMVIQDYNKGIPPLNSIFFPATTFYEKLRIELVWNFRFVERHLNDALVKILSFGQDTNSLFKESYKYFHQKYPKKTNFFLFHRHINEVPRVVTSPRLFDFPRKQPPNTYYINSFIQELQHNFAIEDKSIRVIRKIKSENKKAKIIYCSLGTLATLHSNKANLILNKIIGAVIKTKDFHLLVSLGKSLKIDTQNSRENLHVYEYVNQVQVLTVVDAIVTHGGMNTISECIYAEVPLIVFPLNLRWDQIGNAVRVEYHKIGLKADAFKDSEDKIAEKVRAVVNEKKFKNRIRHLKKEIQKDAEKHSFFDLPFL